MTQTSSPIPTELLTLKSLKTLSGASITVWIVCLVLSSLIPEKALQYWHYRIIAFVLSILITLTIINYKKSKEKLASLLLILGNTCYIFINASGINSISKNQIFTKSDNVTTDSANKSDGAINSKKGNAFAEAGFFSFIKEPDWWPDNEVLSENISLKEQLIILNSKIDDGKEKELLLKKISSLEDQVKILSDGSSEKEKKLIEQNSGLSLQIDSLVADLKTEKEKTETLSGQIRNLNAEIEKLKKLLALEKSKTEQLQKSLDIANQNYQETLNKYNQLLTNFNNNQNSNASLSGQIRSLNAEIEKLKALLENERNRYAQLQNSLVNCNALLKECQNKNVDNVSVENYRNCLRTTKSLESRIKRLNDSLNTCIRRIN